MNIWYSLTIAALFFSGINSKCEFESISLGGIIEDLLDYLEAKWIIFLRHNPEDTSYEKILKYHRNFSTFVYLAVYDLGNFSFASNYFKRETVLVVSICPLNKSSDTWFWNEILYNMKRYYWLMFLEDEDYLNAIHLPFDTSFMILKHLGDDEIYGIHEVYQTDVESKIYYSEMGKWDAHRGLQVTPISFDIRRNNLQRYDLKVFEITEEGSERFMEVINEVFKGAVENIAWKLNATASFSLMFNETFDINLIPIPVYDENLQVPPLYQFRNNIYFKDEKRAIAWDSYLKPFSWDLWIGMVSTGVGCSFGSSITNFILNKLQHKSLLKNKKNLSPFFFQSTIIDGLQIFTKIILNSAYSATFISFITIVISVPPFTDLEGIISNGHYNILTIPTKSYGYYRNTRDVTVSKLFKKHVLPIDQQPSTYFEAFERVCHSNQKLVTDYPSKVVNDMIIKMGHCRMREFGIKLLYTPGGWTPPLQNLLRRSINFWVLRLVESGSMNHMIWVRSTIHTKLENPPIGRPIDIQDTASLYVLWFFGAFFSITIFLVEISIRSWSNNNKGYQTTKKRLPIRRVSNHINLERFLIRNGLFTK